MKMKTTELMPRATIVEIVGHRDRALARATEVFDLVERTNELAKKVTPHKEYQAPTIRFDYSRYRDSSSPDAYRKQLDAAAWDFIISRTGLRDLMGTQQKEQWRKQLEEDPPEFTIETVVATFEGMVGQADQIFLQGLVDVFERLPRDFRSHDGFKFGARCVMTGAVWRYSRFSWAHRDYHNAKEMLHDLDRVFHQLAGKLWIVKAVDVAAAAMERGETECETELFRLRWFRNLNLHVWMKDRKVVDDANRLLGSHYGAKLGWMHLHPDERPAA